MENEENGQNGSAFRPKYTNKDHSKVIFIWRQPTNITGINIESFVIYLDDQM